MRASPGAVLKERSTNMQPKGVEQSRLREIAMQLNDPLKIFKTIVDSRRSSADATATTLNSLTPSTRVAARTRLESELVDLWSEFLPSAEVGVTDNFFSLGGHSLLATQILSRIQERYDAQIPWKVLFEGNFTIEELATYIRQAQGSRMETTPSEKDVTFVQSLKSAPTSSGSGRASEECGRSDSK
jgi:acyl carrier protein